ncbi:MAG: hypothetical protein ACJ8GN_07470 [Longimicrobiaceae bacterium]
MKIWKQGDESRAICPTCERRTDVVFARRTVEIEEPVPHSVDDVLVAVCRECDGIALVPHQSTPRLKEGFAKAAGETVNARIPGHLKDVLFLVSEVLAADVLGEGRPQPAPVLRTLLYEFSRNPAFAERVRKHAADPLVQGLADQDISIKVPARVLSAVDSTAKRMGMTSRAEVVKGVIATAREAILDRRDRALEERLRGAIVAIG